MSKNFESDCDEVDAFLRDAKALEGGEPIWGESPRPGELTASWGIVDGVGVSRAELRFRCPRSRRDEPSVSIVYRKKLVYRIDIVPDYVRKPNMLCAAKLGLPAEVCGPHWHAWEDNREYVRVNGFGPLPLRRPVDGAVRRLPHALAELAARTNLSLGQHQRGFDVPPRRTLFD